MGQGFPQYYLSKPLVIVGFILVAAGLILMSGGRFSFLGLGKFPGDLTYRGKHTTIYVPIVSSLMVSAFLTLAAYFVAWLSRR